MSARAGVATRIRGSDMASIYGLVDPESGELRYIGKANCLKGRLASHVRAAASGSYPVHAWIRKIGKPPEMVTLEEDCEDWRRSERLAINKARAAGFRLLNVASGGDEPHCPRHVRASNGAATLKMLKAGGTRKSEKSLPFEERKKRALLGHLRWSREFWAERGDKARSHEADSKILELLSV